MKCICHRNDGIDLGVRNKRQYVRCAFSGLTANLPLPENARRFCECQDGLCLAHDSARCTSAAHVEVNRKRICNECALSLRAHERMSHAAADGR